MVKKCATRLAQVRRCMSFIRYVEQKFKEEHWSLDACVGKALESGEFSREEIVCTRTLYNYVDAGLMKIANIKLPDEKGTNECHNKMLRRFIPKGRSMVKYSQEDIDYFADIINGLPRKILGYKTPDELFDQELDLIYSTDGAA